MNVPRTRLLENVMDPLSAVSGAVVSGSRFGVVVTTKVPWAQTVKVAIISS